MFSSRTCIAVLLLLATFLARAESVADLDPAKIAAIRELLEVTGAHADQKQLSRTFSLQFISVLRANNAVLSKTAIEIIEAEVKQVVAEQLANEVLQQKMYRIYAQYFTLEELEGLIAFNRSPTGIKANRVMPVLLRESMSAAQQWSEEIGPTLSRRIMARLKEENIDLGLPR